MRTVQRGTAPMVLLALGLAAPTVARAQALQPRKSPVLLLPVLTLVTALTSCNQCGMTGGSMMNDQTVFATNGETIFRTGKNLKGVVLQDLDRSEMKMAHSCAMCHGANGAGGMMMMMRTVPSIRFKDLSDPAKHSVPYNEDLIKRFLDEELKSDGSVAVTGVAWKMSEKDKDDLIDFLKTL